MGIRRCFTSCLQVLLISCLTLSPWAAATQIPDDPSSSIAYVYPGGDGLLNRHAPVFVAEHADELYNRVGTPSARLNKRGREEIYVDALKPAIYGQQLTFETDRGRYTNLIYRVHFESCPFTFFPFNVNTGRNVGAMVVITLNEAAAPVFVTTVQTCGCYHSVLPTNFLSGEAYPDEWDDSGVTVYGEHLPGRIDYPEPYRPDDRLVVHLRAGNHRTKDLRVLNLDRIRAEYKVVEAAAHPVEALKRLPLGEGVTSFYHTRGRKRGLVKGAIKPFETFLFGLWAWDSHVGQDREYGEKNAVGRRFYTTLFFARKERSDMSHYADYLRANGWKP